MSVFGKEFIKDWPLNDFDRNLTNFGQQLLQKCLEVEKPCIKAINIQEFMQKSNEFPLEVRDI